MIKIFKHFDEEDLELIVNNFISSHNIEPKQYILNCFQYNNNCLFVILLIY